MAKTAAPASIAAISTFMPWLGEAAPPVCRLGDEVPVLELEVSVAGLAGTTVTEVTVLTVPSGNVVVTWKVDVVEL